RSPVDHHREPALLALPRDADRRGNVHRPGDHRHPGGHAHRRVARRLPRVLRPSQPRCHHGSDEVLKDEVLSMVAIGKKLAKPVLSMPLALSGGATTTLADYAGKSLVLYFYPKDSTPASTTEGRDFNALLPKSRNRCSDVI